MAKTAAGEVLYVAALCTYCRSFLGETEGCSSTLFLMSQAMAVTPTGIWDSAFQDCSSRFSDEFKASFMLPGLIAFKFRHFHFDDGSYGWFNVVLDVVLRLLVLD